MKRRYTAAAAMMMVLGLCASASAAFDENLNDYTLDTMIVEADAIKNKFGDTITEQSYYRTGGDVKVITREEIEKRHYTDVSEAIKRIPGVVFRNPGYRGGEYGSSEFNNTVSINGDDRVIVLVDGRRVDNPASARMGTKSYYDDWSGAGNKSTGVNIDQVINMEAVDKIEVIKGPGASVYGSDAAGGVINIITRKGGATNTGSIDLATGSWDKHKYSLSYSGSAGNDNSWHYFVSANRDMSGNTKYKDSGTGQDATFYGSKYKEDGVNLRIDKDFNDKQNLKIWYNFKQGHDGYPIAPPKMKYYNEEYWNKLMFTTMVGWLDENNKVYHKPTGWNTQWNVPPYSEWYPGYYGPTDVDCSGYTNFFQVDGAYGSYNSFKNNDLDITYTFNKENGMDSFVRIYNQTHTYSGVDEYVWGVTYDKDGNPIKLNGSTGQKDADGNNVFYDLYEKYTSMYPNGATAEELKQFMRDNLVPFPGNESAMSEWIAKTGGLKAESRWNTEKNRGIQLQLAKSVGIHDIIGNVNYGKAKVVSKSIQRDGSLKITDTKRDTISTYIQDKIHVSDKWDITPAVRYNYYKAFSITDGSAGDGKGSSHQLTPTINTQYMFDDTSSMYFSWTRIYRPIKQGDYDTKDKLYSEPLKDEKGAAYTLGFKKDLSSKTTATVNYNWTHMTNAIATLPCIDTKTGTMTTTPINAREDKKAFNLTLDHQFDDHFMMSASYAHAKNEWKAKGGWSLDPEWPFKNPSDVNTYINSLRPQNHYSLNMSYENRGLYTGLLTNWYTGNPSGFSSRQFLVLDWNLNYEITKDMNAYITVTNLTNEAYETSFHSTYGAYSMPGRCIMVGMKYKF